MWRKVVCEVKSIKGLEDNEQVWLEKRLLVDKYYEPRVIVVIIFVSVKFEQWHII